MNEFRHLFAYGARVRELFMSDILQFIERHDPGAFVYFFGDHGAFVTAGEDLKSNRRKSVFDPAAPATHNRSFKGNERKSVLDNYGILHGFRPAGECREYLADSPEFGKFSVPIMVARGIIRCLADGADPFVKPVHFRLRANHVEKYKKAGYQGSPGFYEEYVYE